MKNMVYYGVLFLTIACSGGEKNSRTVSDASKKESHTTPDPELSIVFPSEEVLETMKVLEAEGDSCKQFFFYKNAAHFIVKGTNGIGISKGKEWLLAMEYNKVYNPEMTLDECVEIKKGNKVGLVHLESGKILLPQFEYIAPQSATDRSLSYGFKGGVFHQIEYKNDDFILTEETFSLAESFQSLHLELNKLGACMLYDANTPSYGEEDANSGNGVLFLPSYLEQLNLWPAMTDDIIDRTLDIRFAFGRGNSELKSSQSSLWGNISTFIVETYEDFFDARGATSQQAALISVDKNNHSAQAEILFDLKNSAFTIPYETKFIRPDLLEFKTEVENESGLYDIETTYKYYQIDSSGGIMLQDRNRHFDCSYFARLDETYFAGVYGHFVKESELTPFLHLEHLEHLSIEDLDVMRNEIYAEYGYRFKSMKWQAYFEQFEWYQPRFDNVDHLLTELEKDNIKTILSAKERVVADRATLLKKKDSVYHYTP